MSTQTPREPEAVRDALSLLDHHFSATGGADHEQIRAAAFHENVIRLIVFDMHLAIEELVRSEVFDGLARRSSLNGEQTIAYVKDLTSRQIIDLAVALGAIDRPTYERLRELNVLRNKAAHHWDLGRQARRDDEPPAHERVLAWDGKQLTAEAVRDDFLPTYGAIYASMLARLSSRPAPAASR